MSIPFFGPFVSWAPPVVAAILTQPDAIILYTNAAPAAVIAKNYQQLGMKTPVICSHGVPTAEFIKLAGKIVEDGRWIIFGPRCLFAEKMSPDDPWRKKIHDPFQKALKEKKFNVITENTRAFLKSIKEARQG